LGAKQQMANGEWRMAGSIGNVGCFSFFPTKNLGAYGDGGMIATNNKIIAEKIKMLRNHGAKKKYYHEFLGVSSRLDELQAAILLAKLTHLKQWSKKRQSIAAFYNHELKNISEIILTKKIKNNFHIYHQYTIRIKGRDELRAYLIKNNIPTAVHYPLPLHLQPAFKFLGYKKGDFPEAEKAAKEVLSLPIYPELKPTDQKFIVNRIKRFYN
jgi:dTDP-4-amino-4,6-dideoxygalactose transaminase